MSQIFRARRSALYMPASNARAMEKAKTLDADVVIFDLEDSVLPDDKDAARTTACDAVRSRSHGSREIVVRANALDSAWGGHDLAEIASAAPDAVLIPKVATSEDVRAAQRILDDNDAPAGMAVWTMMETPLAILNAGDIASVAAEPGSRLKGWVIGTNDLAKDLGCALDPAAAPLIDAISACVLAARAFGLVLIDGVYNNIKDLAGFERACAGARAMGFDGKSVIHPSQIEICNRAFTPPEDEIAQARAIVAAFDLPENRNAGAIMVDGAMAERLHLDMARRTLSRVKPLAG